MRLIPKKHKYGWYWEENRYYCSLLKGTQYEVIRPLFKNWICSFIGHTWSSHSGPTICVICHKTD